MACIALGANLGDMNGTIEKAVGRIGALNETKVVRKSRLYKTLAIGGPEGQPDYLNGALVVETELKAGELMRQLLSIEKELGRDRSKEVRFGPRVIDLDLLLFGEEIREEAGLIVPHPRMHVRRFVLEPLAEIAGDFVHPVLKKRVWELLVELL